MEMCVKLAARSSPGSRTRVLVVIIAVLVLGGIGCGPVTAVILRAGLAGAQVARAMLVGLMVAALQSAGSANAS